MGNRLTRIYTRTGDDGTTGLGAGLRVAKDDLRIEALGTIDELNSLLGLVVSQGVDRIIADMLTRIQHDLFDMGADFYIPDRHTITPDYTQRLEDWLDQLNADLGPLQEFILPGGCAAAASCHVARAVCRRAERVLVKLQQAHAFNADARTYINRLSDLLFVIARSLNKRAGQPDILWNRKG